MVVNRNVCCMRQSKNMMVGKPPLIENGNTLTMFMSRIKNNNGATFILFVSMRNLIFL